MKEFAIYSLEVNLALLLFYGFYRILLYNDTLFQGNRLFLIISALLSLTIPLFKIPSLSHSLPIQVNLNEVLINTMNSGKISSTSFTYKEILSWVYLLGAGILFILFIKNLFQIVSIIRRGTKIKRDGYISVKTANQNAFFSFLNYLVTPATAEEKEEIVKHELSHIRQFHTFDILFFELLSILFWYNPIIYLYKFSIKETHEFLADESVIKQNQDRNSYAKTIVSYALGANPFVLSESFIDSSFLKRRISMLTKGTYINSKKTFIKYFLCLPLLLIMVSLTAFINGNPLKPDSDLSVVYDKADVMPKYNGDISKYLQENIKYPEELRKKGIGGTVFLRFVISKSGKVENIEVLRGADKLLDAEAVRVIRNMPDWTPGSNNGNPVNVHFVIPIHFETK